eukprot:1155948-Pelagomonas_calceolata.AAC.1
MSLQLKKSAYPLMPWDVYCVTEVKGEPEVLIWDCCGGPLTPVVWLMPASHAAARCLAKWSCTCMQGARGYTCKRMHGYVLKRLVCFPCSCALPGQRVLYVHA